MQSRGQLQSFTQKNIQNTSQISDSVKKIIFDNPELLKAVRYFAVKEATSQVISAVSLLSTVLTVSYLVGGLIINSKIQSNKNKAGQLYRECIKNADSVKYDQLRKCAFWGGEDYENLLLSNPQFQRVILDIESEIIVSENRVEKKLFDSKLLGRSK